MKVEFFKHNLSEEEIGEVTKTLQSIFLTTAHQTAKFEEEFTKYLGINYAVGVSSCTAALHLSLLGLGIGPGDEVITTPLSFVATAQAIEYIGAIPVFVDVEPATGNIDISKIEAAITKRTKAILPVHLYGQMCDIRQLAEIAKKHNIYLIEDAAHCIEGERDGVKPGQVSDAACFSFYATKAITSGEGGCVVTNHQNLAEWLKKARLFGISKDAAGRYYQKYAHYDMEFLGFKYNMFDIQASLLLGQLAKISKLWTKRKQIFEIYDKAFEEVGIGRPVVIPATKHAYYLYTIWVQPTARDEILHKLQERGIGVAVNFRPIHLMSYFSRKYGFKVGDYPVAERIGASTVTLPLYPKLTDEEIGYVISNVIAVVKTKKEEKEGISIFFPAYNEEQNIAKVVSETLKAFKSQSAPFEIIVVNDGSCDKTAEIVQKISQHHPEVRLVNHEVNKGYGQALQTGFAAAKFPIIGYTDGDGQFVISEFVKKLVPQLEKADFVTGARVNRADPAIRKLNARLWNLLVWFLFGLKVSDVDCGMKVTRREVLERFKLSGNFATICPELLVKAKETGAKISEIPVTHKPRKFGTQTGANLKVILGSLVDLFKMRVNLWVERYWQGEIFATFQALPRWIRFGTIGSFCFFIQFIILVLVKESLGVHHLIANIPAFAIATTLNFYLSYHITWVDRKNGLNLAETLTRFFLLGLTNEAFYAIFTSKIHYQPGLFMAVLATFIINYFIYSKFVFSAKRLTKVEVIS
jgi:dTDP-4-amino-4,6-dideoxygalactose transaminase/glycosyltransferase involved in cell wall biosynthesis